MILDSYFVKPGPPPFAHPSDVERFECELAIYERLGSHKCILRCHGLHPSEKALRFDYLPNGDLVCYLARTGIDNIPYSTRLQWIVDVAEGITFLHSKGVVWVDVTPSNMLLTDDLRVVLSDFGGSSMPPKFFSSVQPAGVWVAPPNTRRQCPFFVETQDRFAFGTLVFVLLLGCYPHCDGPAYSSYEEQFRIEDLHEAGIFDRRVSNEAYPVLAEVIQKCWRVEYESTEAMLCDAIRGRDEYLKVRESSAMMQNSDGGSSKGTSSAVRFDRVCQ
jgi:serine/threonine protein kinase